MNSAIKDQADTLEKLYMWKDRRMKEIGWTIASSM